MYLDADTKPVFSKSEALDERTATNIAFYSSLSILAPTKKDQIPRNYTPVLKYPLFSIETEPLTLQF